MMPNGSCGRCGKEIWGWGARHKQKSGAKVLCPECERVEEERRARKAAPGLIARLLGGLSRHEGRTI